MPQFSSKEEYEAWKAKRQEEILRKSSSPSENVSSPSHQDSSFSSSQKQNANNKNNRKKLIAVLVILVTSFIIAIPSYYYLNIYQPRKIAEDYLKAVQLHDYEKLIKIEGAGKSSLRDGVLINLINWNFIDKKTSTKNKINLNLTGERYDRDLKIYFDLYKVTSVDDFPHEHLKQEYRDYNTWRSYNISVFEAFEENGDYYYYSDRRRVEYLLDLTATNKLGMELKKKYMLTVEKNHRSEWKVIAFDER